MAAPKKPQAPTVQITLLRGINVGGRHRLPMENLVSIFEDAGARQVQTYIQSGNVIYEAETSEVSRISADIVQDISRRFGWETPVITRTAQELGKIVRTNPFLRGGGDDRELHVAFLASRPSTDRIAGLDPRRSRPDEFVVQGREVYLKCPHGLARSKLTNTYFDSKLGTPSTFRNWKTTLKLLELTLACGQAG